MQPPPEPTEGDLDRLNRSLEELEDLVDQVILYADPRYVDEAKLETPEGAAFARQCREVADYLGSLAVKLQGMLDSAPDAPQGAEGTGDAGGVGGTEDL